MEELQFIDQHNMVAMLSKIKGSEEFHEIINVLRASLISYALTVNPKIFVDQIQQFWVNATLREEDAEQQIKSVVLGKPIVVIETTIRTHLHIDDAEGTSSIPSETLFGELKNMGYEGSLSKFIFYKGISSAPVEIFNTHHPTMFFSKTN